MEALLLQSNDALDEIAAVNNIMVVAAHMVDDGLRHLAEERPRKAQAFAIAHGAPHDEAQDVAPPFVAG